MFGPVPELPIRGVPEEVAPAYLVDAELYTDSKPKPGLILTTRLADGTEVRRLFRYESDVRTHETRKGKPT